MDIPVGKRLPEWPGYPEPGRLGSLGNGACELLEQMQNLMIRNFSLRDLDYSTHCIPRELTAGGHAIYGEALTSAP